VRCRAVPRGQGRTDMKEGEARSGRDVADDESTVLESGQKGGERVGLNSGNDDLDDEKEGRVYVHVLYLLARCETSCTGRLGLEAGSHSYGVGDRERCLAVPVVLSLLSFSCQVQRHSKRTARAHQQSSQGHERRRNRKQKRK
jgi:hypothetical protein